MWPRFFVATLVFSLVLASPKTRDECCVLAWKDGAYLDKINVRSEEPRCGQSYSPDRRPAPDLSVNISWWCDKCEGSGAWNSNRGNSRIFILGAYIVPIAVLATSGPRRRPFTSKNRIIERGSIWMKSVTNNGVGVCVEVLTELIVMAIDRVLWFLSAMLMCGPIVFSCLHEIMLDYGVLRYLRDRHKGGQSPGLGSTEEIELLVAIISGNLKPTGLAVDVPKSCRG